VITWIRGKKERNKYFLGFLIDYMVKTHLYVFGIFKILEPVKLEFNTKCVHYQQPPDSESGSVIPPLSLSTTFDQSAQSELKYFYGRGENPTREQLEHCLAGIEGSGKALTYSSGQAAANAVLDLLKPGDEFISSDDVYGGTLGLFDLAKSSRKLIYQQVDTSNYDELEASINSQTKLIWIESPTNPMLKVTDIQRVCDLASRHGIKVLVDNTFCTPYLQTCMDLGADFVLYSTSKFISGHGDAIGGALVCKDEYFNTLFSNRTVTGAIPSPFDCYIIHRGIKTLGLRLDKQCENAKLIAEFLKQSNKVGKIYYPGLDCHPQYELASRQMRKSGALISFEYHGNVEKLLHGLSLFHCAVSLGTVFSLIECPALMTHRNIPRSLKVKLGLNDNLIRLAIGIEDPDDLIQDLTPFFS